MQGYIDSIFLAFAFGLLKFMRTSLFAVYTSDKFQA
jgi:hypothetical protein